MFLPVAVAVGVVVGVVMGLLGAGGSLLTVPALIFLLGQSTAEATATSLVAVVAMGVSGVVSHAREGRCSFRTGFAFGAAGMVTAAVAGRLASGLPEQVLTGAFVVLLVGTAIWLTVRGDEDGSGDGPGGHVRLKVTGAGAGVGVLTGLLGVGGGFMVVPALTGMLGMPMSMAVGTSQLVILTNAAAGLVGRATGGGVDWALGVAFGSGGVVGAAIGSRIAGRVDERYLRLGFAAVAVGVAGALTWQLLGGGGAPGS